MIAEKSVCVCEREGVLGCARTEVVCKNVVGSRRIRKEKDKKKRII